MSFGHQLAYAAFVTLMTTTLLCQPMNGAAADYANLPASAEEITPLKAGDRAPSFTVRTVEDEPYEFDPDNLERPTVLISFRGGWCPFCNMHLSELRDAIPEIRQMGFDILFLSGDRPDLLYSTLENETREDIESLDYTILSDANVEAALALGTAFRVAESTVARRHEKGQDIDGSSMLQYDALAVPAVYIIDTSGEIAFDYVNPDYRVRLSAEELLAAATKLGT